MSDEQTQEVKEITGQDLINVLRKIVVAEGNHPTRITEPAGFLKSIEGVAIREIDQEGTEEKLKVIVIE